MSQMVPSAAVLIIGNEILSGRTRDANLGFLSSALALLGIQVRHARVIPDELSVIADNVNALRHNYDSLFTTGGIGPTHDDITAEAVALAFGLPLTRHPEALRRLESHYGPDNLNDMRKRMADMPEGALLIDNPISSAPGFSIGNVHVLAGVPMIASAMFEQMKHRLIQGPPLLARTVRAFVAEGLLAKGLKAIQDANPDVSLGSYPFMADQRLGASIVARGRDARRLDEVAGLVATLMRSLNGDPHVETGEGNAKAP
ncbi:MAG: competence/damage-inducible protein A [Alphaproteobacteria bacterium]|nr:competence/damage-inducible protein A [Alphaproteobacteria bacterium]